MYCRSMLCAVFSVDDAPISTYSPFLSFVSTVLLQNFPRSACLP